MSGYHVRYFFCSGTGYSGQSGGGAAHAGAPSVDMLVNAYMVTEEATHGARRPSVSCFGACRCRSLA